MEKRKFAEKIYSQVQIGFAVMPKVKKKLPLLTFARLAVGSRQSNKFVQEMDLLNIEQCAEKRAYERNSVRSEKGI